MATRFEIVLCGADASRLRAAGEEALAEIAALDRQLSFYRPESDVSRINSLASRQPVKVEPRLFDLLHTAVELTHNTNGAFDITIAPLMRAWGLAGGSGQVPTEAEFAEARERFGASGLLLDENDYTVRFARPGMEIDLGAIGKGYAIDRAVETLGLVGVESALIHGGTSTIYGLGSPPGQDAWKVAVQDPSRGDGDTPLDPPLVRGEEGCSPRRTVDLHDCSLSVSAAHGKCFAAEGREYGHVIDPRTGRPTDAAALAAVWGPSPTETDALSTALLVLGKPGLQVLDERFPDYRGLVIAGAFGH